MTKWLKVNGKLCKEMSQESKDKLHAYEMMQRRRYDLLSIPLLLYIERGIYKVSSYTENSTPIYSLARSGGEVGN